MLIALASPIGIAASEIPPPGDQSATPGDQHESATPAITNPAMATQANPAAQPNPATTSNAESSSSAPDNPATISPEHNNPWAPDPPPSSGPLVDQGDPFSPVKALVKGVGALALVIGLMLLIAIVVRKLGFHRGLSGQEELIKVLATRSMGPKKHLAVVAAVEEYFLVSVGEQDINLLARLDHEKIRSSMLALKQPKIPNQGTADGFAGILSGLIKRGARTNRKK